MILQKETPPISYQVETAPLAAEVADLFRRAGLYRPADDPVRIGQMLNESNLIVTARAGEKLVGIARSLTDFVWCCYLADLAVDREYQRHGIGTALIERTRHHVGDGTMLVLLATEEAKDFYPKLGFERYESSWILPRKW